MEKHFYLSFNQPLPHLLQAASDLRLCGLSKYIIKNNNPFHFHYVSKENINLVEHLCKPSGE